MKFATLRILRGRAWVAIGLAFVSVLACSKKESPRVTAEQAKQERLKWNVRTLVDAYEKAGFGDPKWDTDARAALNEFAKVRSGLGDTNEAGTKILATHCHSAVIAGCADPMIFYLHTRSWLDQTNSREVFVEALSAASDRLQQSSYPEIRKFYAALRAAEQISYAVEGTTNAPADELHKYRRRAMASLANALRDKTMPIGEVDDACRDMLNVIKRNQRQYSDCYRMIEQPLFQNWPEESVVWLVKGTAHAEMAWHVRGGGYANTVTAEGWEGFRDHLKIAEDALERAWKINPKDSRIAVKMLWVELGQGQGRKRMEEWFGRAMELDPNNYDACNAKVLYLEPKWHGSIEEMLEFGRECVRSEVWGGRVPLILVDAYDEIPRYYRDASERASFWKRPEVWPDIQSAFDKFFRLNPDEIGWYHNYALNAYRCEQWTKLNELIPKLGPVNYDYFGGKAEFDKMVQLAKDHAAKP